MTSLELTDKKEQLKIKAQNMLSSIKQEQRKFTDDETNEYNTICKEIADTEKELRDLQSKLKNKESIKTEKSMENFSLIKAIRSVANNQPLDERAQEVINQGVSEMRKSGQSYAGQIVIPTEYRAAQATVAGQGAEVVATDKTNILAPIYQNLVMAKAGAQFMTGLVGNVSVPTYSGATVGWKGEVDAAADGTGTFDEVELSPKRLTAFIDVSKQFLIQDSASAEALLRSDIVRAVSNKLEETILGDEAGSTTKPEGIFNGATAATLTYDGTVDMEEELDGVESNYNPCYIVSPAVKATLRKAKTDAGSGQFVYEDNEINGIPCYCTSAAKGIVLGDFSNYVIGQWGATDLVVDPYSQAANGKIRIVINAYFDAKPLRKDAFVKGTVA
jgi:HK97 family phage major capsid protein